MESRVIPHAGAGARGSDDDEAVAGSVAATVAAANQCSARFL